MESKFVEFNPEAASELHAAKLARTVAKLLSLAASQRYFQVKIL
jgi:hypothetical protein